MILDISSTFLQKQDSKILKFVQQKVFLIEIFSLDKRDAKCPTNVIFGNGFG